MRNTNLSQLLSEIQQRAGALEALPGGEKRSLYTLLIVSFIAAMEEVRMGADFDEYADLAVLTFIMKAASEGYPNRGIHDFLDDVQKDLRE